MNIPIVEQIPDTLILCHCGNSSISHNFRHEFDPEITVEVEEDELGHIFTVDANDYPTEVIEDSRCSFPQCRGAKSFHGTIFQHQFTPIGKIEKRSIQSV